MRLKSISIFFACFLAIQLNQVSSTHQKRAINGSPKINKNSEVVEGSGNIPKGISPDQEVHSSGNGYSPDDEDSEIQGSGAPPRDDVEGSGAPMITRPAITTSTTTTAAPSTKVAVFTTATTVPPFRIEEKPTATPGFEIEDRTTSTTSMTTTAVATSKRTPIAPLPDDSTQSPFHHMLKPGIFAAAVGGTIVGILSAIVIVMFIVHRMRKKDEGSYALEEPKPRPYSGYAYSKAPTKEFYA